MPSYRFCRPDDIPRLVSAIDTCYRPHIPGEPPMSVARFRAEMGELDVWPSSCLLAREGDGATAVLIAAKRPDESCILRIGVLPGQERQGHGGHLLASLSKKLAVLGPERLVVELPRARTNLCAFFAALGYQQEAPLTDWLRPPAPAPALPDGLVTPITAADADAAGLLARDRPARAWMRQRPTLIARSARLEGCGIVTPERVEACVLFELAGTEQVDVWSVEASAGARRDAFLGALLRHLAGRYDGRSLRMQRLAEGEVPAAILAAHGFRPGTVHDRWAAVATPG